MRDLEDENIRPYHVIEHLKEILGKHPKSSSSNDAENLADSFSKSVSLSKSTGKAEMKEILKEICNSFTAAAPPSIDSNCQKVRSFISSYEEIAKKDLDHLTRFIVSCKTTHNTSGNNEQQSATLSDIPLESLNDNIQRTVGLIEHGYGIDVLETIKKYQNSILVCYEPLVIVLAVCAICGAGEIHRDVVERRDFPRNHHYTSKAFLFHPLLSISYRSQKYRQGARIKK